MTSISSASSPITANWASVSTRVVAISAPLTQDSGLRTQDSGLRSEPARLQQPRVRRRVLQIAQPLDRLEDDPEGAAGRDERFGPDALDPLAVGNLDAAGFEPGQEGVEVVHLDP